MGVDTVDVYMAAQLLASNVRADVWAVLDRLRESYPVGDIPIAHLDGLGRQLEEQSGAYRVVEEVEDARLAIVKSEGWPEREVDGAFVRAVEISYPTDRSHLVFGPDRVGDNAGGFGFHYSPYNFDSGPEAAFFQGVLRLLNLRPSEVADVYFTGAVTDPAKTDLAFAYRDADGRIHHYTPDFVIRTPGGRWLLVEVKMTARRNDPVEGQQGLKATSIEELVARSPEMLAYRMVFADAEIDPRDVAAVGDFLAGDEVEAG
jgi:hypothetical protein